MQLRLTFDEMALLDQILRNRDRELRDRISSSADEDLKRELESKEAALGHMLDEVVARHLQLSYDELDELAGVVADEQRMLRREIAEEKDTEALRGLELQQVVLKSLLDKIGEACAML